MGVRSYDCIVCQEHRTVQRLLYESPSDLDEKTLFEAKYQF
jgi:hypothetical protein